MTTTVISQTLIETVEQEAQEVLVNFLQSVNAPDYVMQLIEGLRLLDQVESQAPESFILGERGRNAELVGILNRLMVATWTRPGEPVKIPAIK